jgi:hypothetical protein
LSLPLKIRETERSEVMIFSPQLKEGENDKALRLAKESTATASLAQAKTEAGKAKTAETQMQEGLDIIKTQIK